VIIPLWRRVPLPNWFKIFFTVLLLVVFLLVCDRIIFPWLDPYVFPPEDLTVVPDNGTTAPDDPYPGP